MDLINNLSLGFGVAFTFQNLIYSSVRFISRRQVAMPMLMRVPEDSWVSTI